MKPGSLPRLSRRAETLLAVEREIVPQPELVRRRAQLRARTALWQVRGLSDEAGRISLFWRRMGLVAAVALFASSGLAAWIALAPDEGENAEGFDVRGANREPPKTLASRSSLTIVPPEKRISPEAARMPEMPAEQPETVKRATAASKFGAQRQPSDPSEELTLLDRARRAVVGGNHREALALLDRHVKKFPKSELREERAALRVRALKGAGLDKQAGQAASEFESRYPNSVLAPQMNGGRTRP